MYFQSQSMIDFLCGAANAVPFPFKFQFNFQVQNQFQSCICCKSQVMEKVFGGHCFDLFLPIPGAKYVIMEAFFCSWVLVRIFHLPSPTCNIYSVQRQKPDELPPSIAQRDLFWSYCFHSRLLFIKFFSCTVVQKEGGKSIIHMKNYFPIKGQPAINIVFKELMNSA